MNKINIASLFASNLIMNEVDSKFNTIDINKVNFKISGTKEQSSEISDSFYAINDYPELGIEIIKIFQQYTVDVLKLNNQFTISTSWFTRMKPGDTCNMHQHHNCFYSGLYYFDDYEYNSGNIRFFNPLILKESFIFCPGVKSVYSLRVYGRPVLGLIGFFVSSNFLVFNVARFFIYGKN